ncbi:MAG: two-component system, OmpR family, alkaline phosphatase synthesis response regulator PhoP [Bacteroidales bacterium]|jgi:two-component system alkaline phosphatase synthesis response regulator PhoP|nr:two-component system, OmpR family, alkaline phosphatase synthesis response regulator PhoP [Bacteroidales bacterium]MDN5330093.1 two-component system, OmpR family, alkaline phosphatase synthesis response regulator PhoP [Bacteroidales bacterium]
MDNSGFKILLVDDEPDVLEFLSYNLRREGFETILAGSGKMALQILRQEKVEMIILDLMMPEMDGMETCAEIRKLPLASESLIIFLTARGEDYTQIAAFDAGADDFVAKPVKPRVLISRIKALLRRKKMDAQGGVIHASNLTIDKERYTITVDGREITLPRKEFELISLLASKPDRVFTREEIFAQVWGNDVIVGERTIDVHIRKIREKLNIPNIKTVKGIGYKFENTPTKP